MPSQSEAEAAIAGLNGKTFREKTMVVNESRRRTDNIDGGSYGNRRGGSCGGGGYGGGRGSSRSGGGKQRRY
jgi:cold-inducible RNA-binding protein